MSDTAPPAPSLADLATRVHEKANRFIRSSESEDLAKQLSARRKQLISIAERAAGITAQRKLVAAADPKVRLPKRRLSPRLKSLLKLEDAAALDIRKVIEPDAIDADGLDEALGEAEQALLEAWQKFARPPKEAAGADALGDVPELEETVRELRTAREQLETRSKGLPTREADVQEVCKLQQRLMTLSDKLRTYGCDEDVLAFLAAARAGRGISLADVLANPKLRTWLEQKRNAAVFRVLHQSALTSASLFRP